MYLYKLYSLFEIRLLLIEFPSERARLRLAGLLVCLSRMPQLDVIVFSALLIFLWMSITPGGGPTDEDEGLLLISQIC